MTAVYHQVSNITFGKYVPGTTFIHRLDPRTKIVLLVFNSIFILSLDNQMLYLFFGAMLFLLLLVLPIPLISIVRELKGIFWFIAIILILEVVQLLIGKHSLVYFADISVYYFLFKIVFISVVTLIIMHCTLPIDFVYSMERGLQAMNIKKKAFSRLLLIMFVILTFTPLLFSEIQRLKIVLYTRGIVSIHNPLIRIKRFLIILIPLIVLSLRQARCLTNALLVRGYSLDMSRRSHFSSLELGFLDYSILSLIFLLISGSFLL